MRIRTIKPEFFTHEGLYAAEDETKLPIRLAFSGLWCAADREGRFKWEPRRLGVQILPYDGIDFSRVLDALTTRGFVVKYVVKGVSYGFIPTFLKHQVINNRERDSELPPPESNEAISLGIPPVEHASTTGEPRVEHASKEEGKGREGKGTIAADSGEGDSQTEGLGSQPELEVLIEPPTRPPKREPASKPRKRDDVFDALVQATGGRLDRLTPREAGAAGVAMAEIRKASPDVTKDDIWFAVEKFKKVFPDATVTPNAIASHWSRLAPSETDRLTVLIDNHPANKNRPGYVASEVTDGQRDELKALCEQRKKSRQSP